MSTTTGEVLRQEILDYYHSTAKGNGGWRRIGRILGTSGGAASEIAYGHRSPTLRHISRWVESNHSCLVIALPCPTCLRERGEAVNHAHDLDCHGDPDAVAVMVKPSAQQAIALIDQWLADESGHDEAVWPVIEKALRNRSRPTEPVRKRLPVRRPWMGTELSAAMDETGVTDATVRWLVTRHIYTLELAGASGPEVT
jgi:hypothetical protein